MADEDLHELARAKMTRVLGAAKAEALVRTLLAELGTDTIRTPEDLARFAEKLTRLGGFEGAVGGLLGVQAAMRRR